MRAGDVNIKLTADIADLQGKMRQAGGSVDTLAGRLDQLFGYGLAGGGLYAVGTAAMAVGRALFDASAQAERMRTQLDFATGGQSTRELAMVGAIANKLGLEINATAGAYAGFASAARGTALEGDGARSVFEAMAKAAAVMGLSQDQASGALLAVQQMMSKGIVSAEEFRGQLGERMPVAAEAAARAMGVTTAEFNKMLESGQIVAQEFLPKFAAAMNEMLGDASEKAANRLDASVTRMGNAWTALKQSLGDSGISRGIASMVDNGAADMQVMSEAIDRAKRSGSGFFGQMNEGLGALIGRVALLQGVSREFMTLDQAVSDARATIATLDAQERSQGKLSIYQMDERARATRDLARANAELAASGRTATAATATQEGMKAQGVAREAWTRKQAEADAYMADTRGKLNGVSKEYTDTLAKLQQLRDQGLVGESEYVSLMTDLANKHGKAAKAVKDHGDAFAAQRDAAKEWASAIERLQGIQADAEGQATGYSRAQQAAVEVFKSPAFLSAPASWKAVFVATAEAAIAAEQQAEAQKRATEVAKEANKAHADLIAGFARSTQGALDQAEKLQIEEQAAALAARSNVSLAVAIEQVSIARLREKQTEMMGNEDAVLAIQREIEARTRLIALQGGKDGRAEEQKGKDDAARRLDAYLGKDVGTDFAAGFDKASQSLGVFVEKLTGALDAQTQYRQALKDAGGDAAKVAAVEAKNARAQINSYAAMAGAAKGFFRDGSRGYKAMEVAEKALRAYQLVSAVAVAAKEMGLISAVTAAKITGVAVQTGAVATGQAGETAAVGAGEAARNALKIPGVFLSFMSSLGPWGMAAAAAAIAAVWSGSGTHGSAVDMTEQRQAANGTGTVLGDPTAKSESIANAIDLLSDVDTMTMRYSAQMAASLRNIENSMAGVAVQILRAGGIDVSDIRTGVIGRNSGDPILNALGLNLPLIGGFISHLQSLWSKTTATITDVGYTLRGTIADLAAGNGLTEYAEIQFRKDRRIGRDKYWSETRTRDASDEMTRQFALIFQDVTDSLVSAAAAMGQDTARVGQMLAGYVLDIPHLSIEGLTGDALQEALSVAVGAQADKMARKAMEGLGLQDFVRVGEGDYEAYVRVAVAGEQAQQALRGLGVRIGSLADVANKRADDISAELVRASLIGAETTRSTTTSRQVTDTTRQLLTPERWETIFEEWINPEGGSNSYSTSQRRIDATYQDVTTTRTVTDTQRVLTGIGEIINTMSGSAGEIADAYRALTDVRESLQLLGMSGDAVTRGLVQGAGSLGALTDGLAEFEAGFTTAQEQASAASARLKADIERLGLAMPDSAQGFAALVRGIDTSKESGQQLLGAVLQLAGQAADVYGSLSDIADEQSGLEEQLLQAQGDKAAIRAHELSKLSASNRALQQRIWALQDEKERLDALASAGKGISSLIEELRGGASGSASLAQRRAAYTRELQAAQGGDITASGAIAGTARTLIDALKANASDPLQLALETARIAAQLQALPAIAALQQQAGEQASAAISAAATSSQAAAASAAAASSGSASTAASQASTGTELQALRSAVADLTAEVQRLRSGQESGLASIAANTGRSARLLDDLTDDGQSMNVRVKA